MQIKHLSNTAPSLYLSPHAGKLITRSSARRRRKEEGGRRGRQQPAAGRSLLSLSVEIWKRAETLMMSRGFHRGKWKDSKGKWEHYTFSLSPLPLFLVALIKQGKEWEREGGWGREGRESRLEVSHKAQAGAFCSNYRQIGDLDISARWSISW